MNRRSFFRHSGLAALGLVLKSSVAAGTKFSPRILLRSSWQTVNIGDIAHTPGVLSILRKHLPEAARAVAKELKVPCIDLHAASIALHNQIGPEASMTFNPKVDDTTHFNKRVPKPSLI